jgi:hypothetical protein
MPAIRKSARAFLGTLTTTPATDAPATFNCPVRVRTSKLAILTASLVPAAVFTLVEIPLFATLFSTWQTADWSTQILKMAISSYLSMVIVLITLLPAAIVAGITHALARSLQRRRLRRDWRQCELRCRVDDVFVLANRNAGTGGDPGRRADGRGVLAVGGTRAAFAAGRGAGRGSAPPGRRAPSGAAQHRGDHQWLRRSGFRTDYSRNPSLSVRRHPAASPISRIAAAPIGGHLNIINILVT